MLWLTFVQDNKATKQNLNMFQMSQYNVKDLQKLPYTAPVSEKFFESND